MARAHEQEQGPEVLSGSELRDRLRGLPSDRRRDLLRSVRRGEPIAARRDVNLAISVARRQQRTAQFSWPVIPVIAFSLWALADLQVVAAIVATIISGYVATLALARAVRAERTNRGLLEEPSPRGAVKPSPPRAGDAGRSRSRPRGHLPGEGP